MRNALIVVAILLLQASWEDARASDPASEVIVAFSRHGFDPATVEVRRGVRVTFHNVSSSDVLNVVAADGSFKSWPLGEHGEWSHAFSETGRYEFHVKEHPDVKGAVVVR